MRNRINVAAASVNQIPLDWDGNRDRIVSAIDQAKKDGAAVICLPELCITGYGCEDMFLAPEVGETAWKVLEQLIPHSKDLVVAVGLPIWFQSSVFNGVAVFANKTWLAMDCTTKPVGSRPGPKELSTSLPQGKPGSPSAT